MSNAYTGVAITGRAGVGKSTLARVIRERRSDLRLGSFAAALKADLATLGCEKGDPGFREVAQAYGTEFARAKYGDDYWHRRLLGDNGDTLAGLVIDDCRFPDEADLCLEHGLLLVRLTALPEVRASRLGYVCPTHPSETALDDYPHDVWIDTQHTTPALSADIVCGLLEGS